jgi:hypothetical protein
LLGLYGHRRGELADRRAAGRAVNFCHTRALADFPNQGVLASAAADDENSHKFSKIEDGRWRIAIVDPRSKTG